MERRTVRRLGQSLSVCALVVARSAAFVVGNGAATIAARISGSTGRGRATTTALSTATRSAIASRPGRRTSARREVRMKLEHGDIYWAKELINGMHYRQLGQSDLVVSEVCLGTMTWGEQNTDQEAVEQLDFVFDNYGVNFVDTAEIYPVPTKKETQGRSEVALGKWLKRRNREDLVVATKVAGRSDNLTYLRDSGEGTRVRKKDIVEAVDKSLKRLGTDYIDLLQYKRDDDISFEEQLEAFDHVVKQGKVRYIGCCNETTYGITKMAQIGERLGYPRICSVQNNYNLLVRAETELSGMPETVSRKALNVSFLAYSPMAGGVLTGKYQDPENMPKNGRLNLFKGFMNRYRNSESDAAVTGYLKVADSYGLPPPMFALQWCYSRDWITSTIIGATSIKQLRQNMRALNVPILPDKYEMIAEVYRKYRDPTVAKRLA